MKRGKALPIALIILVVVVTDQIVKYIIRQNMVLGQSIPDDASFLSITYALNDGVAFSMLRGMRWQLVIIQSVLVIVILVVMKIVLRHMNSTGMLIAFSLMLGGGLGNLSDRLATGEVTDFISVGDFPIFNIADMCLTIGCAIMILCIFLSERDKGAVPLVPPSSERDKGTVPPSSDGSRDPDGSQNPDD
jgi:signal peptidase II